VNAALALHHVLMETLSPIERTTLEHRFFGNEILDVVATEGRITKWSTLRECVVVRTML
jgi:hypothetical protein